MHIVNHDTTKAIECFERVLKHTPDNVDALKLLGSLYSAAHKRTRALEVCRSSLRIPPI